MQKKAEHNEDWRALLPGPDPCDSLEVKHCHITQLSVRGDTGYQGETHLPHVMKGLSGAFVDMTCFFFLALFLVSLAETMPLGDDISTSELSVVWQNHPGKPVSVQTAFPLNI